MKKNNKTPKRQQTIIVISFILGAIMMLLVLESISILNNSTVLTKSSSKKSLNSAIEKVYDAAVYIETSTGQVKESTGSGFIYKKDKKYAYILTNEHVLEGDTIEITTSDDETIEGKLLGKDVYLDLAVIRIDKKYAKKTAIIGSSSKIKIGDPIFTIGSPLGEAYQGSVSSGIISGKDRMVQTTVGTTMSDNNWLMSVLQFDASINPGNSGGPLLNANGEVIGIVTMKLIKEEIEGMSFAIPIEDAIENVSKLEKGKEIKWPELGISMVNISGNYNTYSDIEIPEKQKEGVIVLSVKSKSSAENAQLERGDIITKINGKRIKNTAYLKYELFKYKIGETIEVTYIRNSKESTTSVKLSSSED